MKPVTRWAARFALAAASLACAGAAPAAFQEEPPERETRLVVYGEDPCPQASDEEEIVVCARRPEEERYRIPRELREGEEPIEVSWGSRVDLLEEAARDMRPDSCSVVGSGGQTGCTQQMLRQWHAERRARRVAR